MRKGRIARVSPTHAEHCADLYEDGYTLEEVARRVRPRLTQSGVRGVLKRRGVKLRDKSEAAQVKALQLARWEASYLDQRRPLTGAGDAAPAELPESVMDSPERRQPMVRVPGLLALLGLLLGSACQAQQESMTAISGATAAVVAAESTYADTVVATSGDTLEWRWLGTSEVIGPVTAPDPDPDPEPEPEPAPLLGWFVAPNGSGTLCTEAAPCALSYGIAGAGGKVDPGDTVWVRGGSYVGDFEVTVDGSSTAQVTFKAYPGERAMVDGRTSPASASTWDVKGDYVTTWGLEVVGPKGTRRVGNSSDYMPNGVVNYGRGNRYVSLTIHDTGNGFFTDPSTSQDVELIGSILYNQGWEGSDRAHGPGVYPKSHTGPVTIRGNVIFHNCRNGIQAYTSSGYQSITNVRLLDNISFRNGTPCDDGPVRQIELGGERPVIGGQVLRNWTYLPANDGIGIKVGYSGQTSTSVAVEDNLAIGGHPVVEVWQFSQQLVVRGNRAVGGGRMLHLRDNNRSGTTWTNNQWFRAPTASAWAYNSTTYRTWAAWQSASQLGSSDQAGGSVAPEVKVWTDEEYDVGRSIITVYQAGAQVAVTVPALAGKDWTVHHVYDLWGPPLAEGTGSAVSIPVPADGQIPAPGFICPSGCASDAFPVGSSNRAFSVFVVRPVF